MNLLVGAYKARSEQRQNELLDAFEKNIENPLIDWIHVFNEDGLAPVNARHERLLHHRKVHVVRHDRMTYKDYFEYANLFCLEDICCIVNADCYLDETIEPVLRLPLYKTFVTLTRRGAKINDKGVPYGADAEVVTEGFCPQRYAEWSQDAWIFRAPVRVPAGCDFPLGEPRCDNVIVYLLHMAGYEHLNPSLDVRLVHLHTSGERNYTRQIRGPGAGVEIEHCPVLKEEEAIANA